MKRRKESYDSDFLKTVLREATMSKCEMKNPPDFFVSLDIWEDVCREIKSFTNNVGALIELSYGRAKIYGCNVYLAEGAPGRTIKVGRDVEGNTPLKNKKGEKQDADKEKTANLATPGAFECAICRYECYDTYPHIGNFKFCPSCGKKVLERGSYPNYHEIYDAISKEKRKEIGENNIIALYMALIDTDATE